MVSYTPTVWRDGSAAGPFLSATNLNKIEKGIQVATEAASNVDSDKVLAAIKSYLDLLVPIGTVIAWGAPMSAPRPEGWLDCNGLKARKADYPRLAQLLGDTWGRGDSTYFVLPPEDVIHRNRGANDPVGLVTGSDTHQLTVNEMPPHEHEIHRRGRDDQYGLLQQTDASPSNRSYYITATNSTGGELYAASTGGGQAFSVRPKVAMYRYLIRAK